MSQRADRVGVRADQVDVHGRVISHSFLNDLIESLPEWTDMPVWVNGTEEILPSNSSVPVTSPILADIQYPDMRRNDQYFTYRESPTTVDGLAKLKRIKGNTLVDGSTLIPFKGTSIKTVGKNLLPKMTPSVVNGITWTVNDDGTVVANGTASANSDSQLTVEFTLLEGNYYFNGCPDGGNDGSTWNCYIWDLTTGTRAKQWDRTSNVLNNTSSTQSRQFYSNGTNRYAYNCRVMRNQTVSNLVFKPMVRLSDADDVYEPYTSSTTDLPTSTYFPNGMKSAGNVYDELLPNKAITRVGMVDLGTLTWYQLGSRTDGYYTDGIPSGAKNTGIANVQSVHYSYSNEGATAMPNMTMKMDNNQGGYLYMVNSSIVSNPTDFKNSLSGEILFYELATPIELPTMSFE